MIRRLRANEGGFSLVELLVVVLVGGVLLSAIAGVVVAMLRTQRFVTTTRENLDEARVAVERIRQDLRGARRIQTTGPSGSASSATQLVFWVDENQDQVTQAAEQIVYQLRTVDGRGRLERFTGAATTPVPLVVGLDLAIGGAAATSQFTYDAAPLSESTLVTVVLTVANTGDERAAPLAVTEQLRLRNAPTS